MSWKILQSPCGPLLSPEDIGITLTDGYAIQPGAAVSGWYFSHPEARDFGIGEINRR